MHVLFVRPFRLSSNVGEGCSHNESAPCTTITYFTLCCMQDVHIKEHHCCVYSQTKLGKASLSILFQNYSRSLFDPTSISIARKGCSSIVGGAPADRFGQVTCSR